MGPPPDWKPYPMLYVAFDSCDNIDRYVYHRTENDTISARYPVADYIPDRVVLFEEDRYGVIKAIMGGHPPPPIQVSEFGMSPDEVRCNGGLGLYMRDGGLPVCIMPQTYERLLERGLELEPVSPMAGIAESPENTGGEPDYCTRYAEQISGHDVVPRYTLCNYKRMCEGHQSTPLDERSVLEEDYLTQQFLGKNPGMSLDDAHATSSGGFLTHAKWTLQHGDSYPRLTVTLDMCSNIVKYSYHQTEGDRVLVEYPVDDYVAEKVAQFEEDRDDLAAKIVG